MSIARALQLEPTRFLIAGAWNTAFGYIVFLVMHSLLSHAVGTVGILVASYAIALPQAFLTQRFWVFRNSSAWHAQFVRFSLSSAIIFVANLLGLPFLIRHASVSPAIGQGIFVAASTIASYLAHKHFSFRK